MQATIYVTAEALKTANAIKDLDYYDRVSLSDDESTALCKKEGYFLKNANTLHLAALPCDARIGLRLGPADAENYRHHVSMPINLRGCIFEKAPHLPEGYAEIVAYWSGTPVNKNTSGAVYFQNPQNEYMVDLTAVHAAEDDTEVAVTAALMDNLLSEGVVVCITGVERLIADLSLHHFIEVQIPINQPMLGLELEGFRSEKAYESSLSQQYERIYLKVANIISAPDRDRIFIDILRHELLDYGYWY